MRWLVLLLTAPLWLPLRLLRAGLARLGRRPVVHVTLSGRLPDVPETSGLLSRLRPPTGIPLTGLLDLLEGVASDPGVETLVVRLEDLHCGLGRAEEARAALARVRDAGKAVNVHADELDLTSYWLAQAATSLRLAPTGGVAVSGVGMEITLARGLLDRAGVRAQLHALGEYKSAREVFTETRASEANREMTRSLVGDLAEQLTSAIAAARGKTQAEVEQLLAAGPFRGDEALAAGLVDRLQYPDELWLELGGEDGRVQRAARYAARRRARRVWPARRTRVALNQLTGNIRMGQDRFGPGGKRATGHLSLCRAVRRARRSSRVAAIVLRVDSPGGSALASDLIWRELTLAARKKPLIVSMANVAASGGYYASGVEGATSIALPTTITGSIGVLAGKFEISGLLDKLGITREPIGSGPRAGYYSVSTPWGPDELSKLDRDLEAHYRDFVAKMARARRLDYDQLEPLARGRVWTGRQAHERKLVDQLGGLHEAELAVRESLQLEAGAALRWAALTPPRGLAALRQRNDEAHARQATALLAHACERAGFASGTDWLEGCLDLAGERLLAILPFWRWPGR
jgi:protease-4